MEDVDQRKRVLPARGHDNNTASLTSSASTFEHGGRNDASRNGSIVSVSDHFPKGESAVFASVTHSSAKLMSAQT